MKTRLNLFRNDIKEMMLPGVLILAYYIGMMLLFRRVCPFLMLTGYPCPGCGMTRALLCTLTGRFMEAVTYNATVFLWIALAVYHGVCRYVLMKKPAYGNVLMIIAGCLTIAYYIYRMICIYPEGPVMIHSDRNLLDFLKEMFIR